MSKENSKQPHAKIPPNNLVHRDTIPGNIISSKPNSLEEILNDQEEGDRTVIDVIKRHEQPPTQKYEFPQTAAEELGFFKKEEKKIYSVERFEKKRIN